MHPTSLFLALEDRLTSIHRESEKAHSRKLVVASPASNIAFIAVRAVSPRDPVTFCRDKATPTAGICYEELQVVAAELLENSSCVATLGCVDQRTTHDSRHKRAGVAHSVRSRRPGFRHSGFSEAQTLRGAVWSLPIIASSTSGTPSCNRALKRSRCFTGWRDGVAAEPGQETQT